MPAGNPLGYLPPEVQAALMGGFQMGGNPLPPAIAVAPPQAPRADVAPLQSRGPSPMEFVNMLLSTPPERLKGARLTEEDMQLITAAHPSMDRVTRSRLRDTMRSAGNKEFGAFMNQLRSAERAGSDSE